MALEACTLDCLCLVPTRLHIESLWLEVLFLHKALQQQTHAGNTSTASLLRPCYGVKHLLNYSVDPNRSGFNFAVTLLYQALGNQTNNRHDSQAIIQALN